MRAAHILRAKIFRLGDAVDAIIHRREIPQAAGRGSRPQLLWLIFIWVLPQVGLIEARLGDRCRLLYAANARQCDFVQPCVGLLRNGPGVHRVFDVALWLITVKYHILEAIQILIYLSCYRLATLVGG